MSGAHLAQALETDLFGQKAFTFLLFGPTNENLISYFLSFFNIFLKINANHLVVLKNKFCSEIVTRFNE